MILSYSIMNLERNITRTPNSKYIFLKASNIFYLFYYNFEINITKIPN